MTNDDTTRMGIDEQLAWLLEGTYFADEGDETKESDLRKQMTAELKLKLTQSAKTGTPLRIYLGVDPTSDNLHIGHMIPVKHMWRFQQLGHTVIFLMGDYTAMIGDPTGQSKEREQLTHERVKAHAEFYADQAFRLLDSEKTEIRYNGEWLAKMGFSELAELAARFSLNSIAARQDFRNRIAHGKDVGLHETFYALMQGYDAFALNCDVQIGAYDQHLNMLAGRTLQKYFKAKLAGDDHPQFAAHPATGKYAKPPHVMLTLPLLMGTDGRKMSKSWGNTIDVLAEPADMYGKVMRISDEMITNYIDIAVEERQVAKDEWKAKIADDPMGVKKWVASRITALYHGEDAANDAAAHFQRTVQEKAFSDKDVEEVDVAARLPAIFELGDMRSEAEEAFAQVDESLELLRGEIQEHEGKHLMAREKAKPILLVDVIVGLSLAPSKKEAQRLIVGGGVKLNDVPVTDKFAVYEDVPGTILRVGKRKVVKLV